MTGPTLYGPCTCHLTGVIGLDPGRAEQAVADLGNYLTKE